MKSRNEALDILEKYQGQNPYILSVKRDVVTFKKLEALNDFAIEYIRMNWNYQPRPVMKTVKMADWWAQQKMEEWKTDVAPLKLRIYSILGETSTTYHCIIQYRKSVPPEIRFLAKKAVLTDFLSEDYSNIQVDFDRYDRLSMMRDPNRRVKDFQKTAVKFLLARKKCILADEMGFGKMEPVSAMIPTPDGFKRMGDIKPGDYVFSRNGKKTQVLRTYPHKDKEIYRVNFTDGTYAECGLEHLWIVREYGKNNAEWRTMSLQEVIDADGILEIPIADPVEFSENANSVGVNCSFDLGYAYGSSILSLNSMSFYRIPDEILQDSVVSRERFLEGVEKSPISCEKGAGQYEISVYSEENAGFIAELANSLGKIVETGIDGENGKMILNIYSKEYPEKFHRIIESVEYVRNEDAQCLAVDSEDHSYLTGHSYIVTHNTLELTLAAIEGNFDSVLIICPASIKTTWRDELLWYVPERDITIIEGINDKNKAELETYLGYGVGKSGKKVDELKAEAKAKGKWQDNRFVIVNYDILDEFYEIPATRSRENINRAFQNSPMLQYIYGKKSLVIIDEAHRLSNSTSHRYKILKDLIKKGNPDSIYEATGTPITNSPVNFFNVLQLIGSSVADDYNYYVSRYCAGFQIPAKGEKEKWTREYLRSKRIPGEKLLTFDQKGDLKKYIREHARMITIPGGESNLEELKERTASVYLRRVKEDLKGMVKKTIHELFYNLTMEQELQYNTLWDEYEAAQLEADPEKEVNKELLEGGLYRRYLSVCMVPNTIKLVDELLETGDKVVIGCCFDAELYQLKDYYGDRCVIFNGKCTPKEKDRNKDRFINDPSCRVFIGNITAAGMGLTLTVATKLVFSNFSYVPGDNQQFMDRIHRISQTRDVDIYFQIFRGTQYEKMWEIVMKKELVINSVIKKEGDK